jgi:hypothetical protein
MILASLVAACALVVVTATVPAPLVLPALGLALVLCGAGVGIHALATRGAPGLSKQWLLDVAGILVLFGFAAAILSDKSEALQLLCEMASIGRDARAG